jgi:hypothetical protein
VIVVSEKFYSIGKSYVNSQFTPFLVAEGTGVTAHRELVCLQNCRDGVFSILNVWFKARKLSLNFHKTSLIQFSGKKKR